MPEDELVASLRGLSVLLVAQGALEQTLGQVARLALQAIPDADGAGLVLLQADRPQAAVASDDLIRRVDETQYTLSEGPGIAAAAEGHTVISYNLGGEPRFPRFGPRCGRLGVHSAMSLALTLDEGVIGVLNLYGHRKRAFAAMSARRGEAFAAPAAVSVANAQRLAQAERLVGQLEQALSTREQIDQAIGLLMGRTGVDARRAFERLREMSQTRSVRLETVAQQLLDQAAGSARAHRGPTPGKASPEGSRAGAPDD